VYGWLAIRLSLAGFFTVAVICSGIMVVAALVLTWPTAATGSETGPAA
jgi:hypothetical protein